VGKVKLARYGEAFMGIIRAYSREKSLTEKPKQGVRQWRTPTTGRHLAVGEAFNGGQSVEDLMAKFQVKQITILKHLERYALEGFSLRADGGIGALSKLPEEKKKAVMAAFEELGTEYLKPVFEQLEEAVPYDDLRILRLHCLSTRATK
jgi:ATP-dependent DNA helicase RecQ